MTDTPKLLPCPFCGHSFIMWGWLATNGVGEPDAATEAILSGPQLGDKEVCPAEKPSAEGPYKGETVYENGEGDSKEIITGPLLPEDGVDIDKFDNSGDIAQLGNVAFREGQKSRDAELKEAMELLDEAVDNERGEKWLTRFIALGKKVQL